MGTTEPKAVTATGVAARFVGASVARKEDRRLLTGHGTYVDDIAVAGVLHAAFVRSDVASGRIVAIDTEAAAAVEGVRAVLLAADLDSALVGPIRPTLTLGDLRSGPPPRMLASDDVRYTGEPVVMVIADS